jgi:hypothetical protein
MPNKDKDMRSMPKRKNTGESNKTKGSSRFHINRKIVIAVSLVLVFSLSLFGIIYLSQNIPDDHNSDPNIPIVPSVTEFAKFSQNESLNDVSKYQEFGLFSEQNITNTASLLLITNQNGIVPGCSVAKENETKYILKPPSEGYKTGDTYKIELLSSEIFFADETFSDRRSITFSVEKPDIVNVSQKDAVIEIETSEVFTVNEESNKIVVNNSLIQSNSIVVGSLIILPVYDEYGFETKNAYKVSGISGNELIVEKPTFDEVFNELEVKGTFNAVYSDQYFHLFSEGEIEAELMNSSVVRAIAASSSSSSNPVPNVSVQLKDGKVIITYSVKFPGIFKIAKKDVDFEVKGVMEVRVGARADIDILNGTFNVGGIVSYTNKYQYILRMTWKPTGEDDAELFKQATKKLTDLLNEKAGNKELSLKVFETFIPSPIPVLGFSFEVKIKFKLEIKVELQVTFTDEFSLEVGVKKDKDGINPYFNKVSKKDVGEIELRGSIEARLGLEVKFSGSAAGILKAGISFEIGIYTKIAGFAKAKYMSDLTFENFKPNSDTDAFVCYGFYFETGVYSLLSLFAEVDLKVVTYEAKLTLLEVNLPIFSVGYTERIELVAATDSLVFDANGKASLPDIKVITRDMFTGKVTEKTVKKADLKDMFDIAVNSPYFAIDNDNNVYLKNWSVQEFDGDILFQLHAWQSFMPKINLNIGMGSGTLSITGSRGIYHYELVALFAHIKIGVTKQPIAPAEITLDYERIVDDSEYATLHPNFTQGELDYNFREDIGGVKDFQIGRLVKVIPTFQPANTSYKTLVYVAEKGSQYIVGGTNGISTYVVGGVTYAVFRVIDNISAIGNADGVFDWNKEIKISATTNGYTGNYELYNKKSTDSVGILASSIPVISYEFSPIVEGSNFGQTAVRAGDEVSFGIIDASVFPRNATRGSIAYEVFELLSGPATLSENKISVALNAQVDSQIVLLSSLSGVERYYYLNVVKKAVETIEIIGGDLSVLPGQERTITAFIGTHGGAPTINEAFFIITRGADWAEITIDAQNKNKAYLSVKSSAQNGEIIEIVAIVDGQRSNTLTYAIAKTAVSSIVLSANNSLAVKKGDVINLSTVVSPGTATFNTPNYYIESGENCAVIDSNIGRLQILYACRGGEQIIVRAVADSVQSNAITFVVEDSPVVSIQFVNSALSEYVLAGKEIVLDAFVNSASTNLGVEYTIIAGASYCSLNGNILTVNAGVSVGSFIHIKATAAGNSAISATKMFNIVANLNALSINGKFDTVKIMTNESPYLTVTDSAGTVVDNSLVTFTAEDQYGGWTDLLSISADGRIMPKQTIAPSMDDLVVIIYANYASDFAYIIVEIVLLPEVVEIVLASDNTTRAVALKPNQTANLAFKVTAQSNTAELTDITFDIIGNANVYVRISLGDFGEKVYSIILQVGSDAETGEVISLTAKYIIDGGYVLSSPFTVTVLRLANSISITNAPDALNLGESYSLKYITNPEVKNAAAIFEFTNPIYAQRATLNAITGVLTINDDSALLGNSVKVRIAFDGLYSDDYEIRITDVVHEIEIGASSQSVGVQYIEEFDFFLLYPNGEFIISQTTKGGEINPQLDFVLDIIGERYLTVTDNKITVKNVDINSGISATLMSTKDGVVSNLIVIYIPTVIKTTQDWFNIQKNINGYYVLGNDIYFTNTDYTPLRMFSGIIDGAGFALRDITLTDFTENNNVGLIEENYGIIINLSVKQLAISITKAPKYGGMVFIGGIIARNYGHIINCKTVSIEMRFMYIIITDTYTGGIAGYNKGLITLCENWIYIQTSGVVGGIAGINATAGVITDSMNGEFLSATKYNKAIAVVGIVGELKGGIVTNCENYGSVFDMEKWDYVE